MEFDVTKEEAVFIINTLGSLATQAGAFPLWVKLQQQYNNPPAPAVEEVQPVKKDK